MKHIYLEEVFMIEGVNDVNKLVIVTVDVNLNNAEGYALDGISINNLPNFLNKFKEHSNHFLNFTIKNNLPTFNSGLKVNKLTEQQFLSRLEHYRNLNEGLEEYNRSVLNLLSDLSLTDTQVVFEEKYYSDFAGGQSYVNFIPNFDTARVNLSNVIISNSKFNVVLTATIDGTAKATIGEDDEQYEIGQVFTRFVPFKLIKAGKLKYDSIKIKVEDRHIPILKKYYPQKTFKVGEVHDLDLRAFKIFSGGLPRDLNLYRVLLSQINMLKASEKGIRYYLKQLKLNSEFGEYEANEWYRGEPVDDDYISDVGDYSFEIWLSGMKKQASMENLLDKLGTFGNNYRVAVELVSKTQDFNGKEFKEMFDNMREHLTIYFRDHKSINVFEYTTLITCISTMDEVIGIRRDRIDQTIKQIKGISTYLNVAELRLLDIRFNWFEKISEKDIAMNNELTSLGEYVGDKKDSVTLATTGGTEITFKRAQIQEKKASSGFSFEDTKPRISSEADVNDFN